MRKLARTFRGVLDNVRPQGKVQVGIVEGGGSGGGSGYEGVVIGSGGIEPGGASASTSVIVRTRGADRRGFHGRGHGGRDGSGGH